MRDSDLAFVRRGLSETNWQDIPEDQKRVLNRAECDKRIFADFERYLNTERFKFRVFIAELDTYLWGSLPTPQSDYHLVRF